MQLFNSAFKAATILGLIAAGFGCGGVGATPEASLADVPSKGPVGKTIRKNSDKFVACARDSVTVQTGTTQNLTLKFTISGEGQVTKAAVDGMSSPDPDLQGCVVKALKRLRFPVPGDRAPKQLTYPLVLKPE
ncbi:MAG: energy transducer TonB [Deltaproteobacteria bacterium]|nr:energy transducer TonB [Deltaproteobacteria bacterium]